MENKFMGNDHLSLLKSAVEASKQNLRTCSETIDMLIAVNPKAIESVNITYLFALSELAKAYSQYNFEDNIGQLMNFFTIADTISIVQNGIAREIYLNEQLRIERGAHNIAYANILKESTNPSNYYPGSTAEYDKRKAEALAQFESISEQYKLKLSKCKDLLYPTELLQRKNNNPFVDKDGKEYSSIIEYVSYIMNLQEELQKTNGSIQKK